MMPPRACLLALALPFLGFAGHVAAQTATPPAAPPVTPPASPQADPALNDPSIDDRTAEQRKRPGQVAPVPPLSNTPGLYAVPTVPAPALPKMVGGAMPTAKRYPEGSFFTPRQGVAMRTRTGDLIFQANPVADPGTNLAEPRAEPPMVLILSQRTERLWNALNDEPAPASIGGQIFVYRGYHYLMPSSVELLSLAATEPPSPQPASALPTKAAPVGTTTPVTSAPAPTAPEINPDPAVEDLIRELESRRAMPRASQPDPVVGGTATPDAQPPSSSARASGRAGGEESLVEEGTLLVSRRGRLLRQGADGRIVFSFDNDPNSPAPAPMTVLPTRQLESLEGLLGTRGESAPIRISGRVLAYRGKNYLLVVAYQATRNSDITPGQ